MIFKALYNVSVVTEPSGNARKKEMYDMNAKKFLALAFAATLVFGGSLHAQTSTWAIDTAHSQSDFQIRHMGVSTVRGAITGVKGTIVLDEKDITKSKVDATLDASTINTGTDARDKHLKSPDFFDVTQFPTITFKSTSIAKSGDKLQLIGDLTLHGVTKSVTLDVDGPAPAQKGQGGKTISGFSASGVLKRADFGIGTKFAATMLGDDVKFTIDLEIDKQ